MWASEVKMIREEMSELAVVYDEECDPSGWEIWPGERGGGSKGSTSPSGVDDEGKPDKLVLVTVGRTPVDSLLVCLVEPMPGWVWLTLGEIWVMPDAECGATMPCCLLLTPSRRENASDDVMG
jgi:hypothetical protein